MAYITKANIHRILAKTDLNKASIVGEIYKQKIYFFAKYEERNLLAIKELIENPERFVDEYYHPIDIRDSMTYVYEFEGKKPLYHKRTDCKLLQGAFSNIIIPIEIKELGKDAVIEFRNWFKTVEILFHTDPDAFYMRLYAKYGIISNPKGASADNSGIEDWKNLDLNDLENAIDNLIIEVIWFQQRSDKNNVVLNFFSKGTHFAYSKEPIPGNKTKYTDEEVKSVLIDFDRRFKTPLKRMLTQYYMVKFNPELNMNGFLLNQLNFKPCSHCYEKHEGHGDSLESTIWEDDLKKAS